jgi:tRNA-Thr(GGU) m(6)t(6)A37 methyltransferase TsaA
MQIEMHQIGRVHSCFSDKFGIPRQPGLVPAARARVELLPPFDRPEALAGIAAFSHLWLVFLFHAHADRPWKAKVRPPRLGGNRKVGVFASRAAFRPNPIGLSAVRLERVLSRPYPGVEISGADLLDGTPVLDIKPYLPYADCIADAGGGYARQGEPARCIVDIPPAVAARCRRLEAEGRPNLLRLIQEVLACDPRPAYRSGDRDRCYGLRLFDLEIQWRTAGDRIRVTSVAPAGG